MISKMAYPRHGYKHSKLSIGSARFLEKFFPRPTLGGGAIQNESPRFLLIELFGLGDVASLSVTFDPLLRRFPGAKIHILCQPWCVPLYAADSRVYEVIGMPTPWKSGLTRFFSLGVWASVVQVMRRLRKIGFDWCIETRGDIRSQILARWTRPKFVVGPCDYMGSNMVLRGDLLSHRVEIPQNTHRYQRNCDCLAPIFGEPVKALLPSLPIRAKKITPSVLPRLLIHPAGGWKYKHWPVDRWRQLLLHLSQNKEWETGLLCAPGEENGIERISKGFCVTIERAGLSELLSTIQSYDAMVATDSGPINLAILSGIPVVDIMGPGDSTLWGPPPGLGILLQNTGNYPCHPCLQRKCVFPSNPCIQQIHWEEVKNALVMVRQQLGTRPAR